MPVCMALIGDRFALAVRQIALSRFIGATLIGQLVGASVGGLIAEGIGWRGVMACAAALGVTAAGAAVTMLPKAAEQGSGQLHVGQALARYSLVLKNPRSFVCFGIVFLEGLAIYGVMPFIGDLLRSRDAGGLREAGFVIGGLGIGGLLYAFVVPLILRFASRLAMMAAGGGVAALGLGGVGLAVAWGVQMACMVVLGFGFFLLHNSVQTEVTELAPSARASAFSLHAFSFFMGQALGPMVYGLTLPVLSSNSVVGPRMAASFGIEFPDGIMDGLIEVVRSGEGLVGEVMPLQVAPETLDIVQLRSGFRQPLDREPVGPRGEGAARRLAGVDRTVIEDQNEGLDRDAERGTVAAVDLLQESDEV
jgi:predicted MFS family arabinose efflux permease